MTTSDEMYSRSIESSEWELEQIKNVRNSRLFSCCPNPFIDLDFRLLLRRRPTFASHVFIAPSVILCLITPSIFLMPPASFEKLTLGQFFHDDLSGPGMGSPIATNSVFDFFFSRCYQIFETLRLCQYATDRNETSHRHS